MLIPSDDRELETGDILVGGRLVRRVQRGEGGVDEDVEDVTEVVRPVEKEAKEMLAQQIKQQLERELLRPSARVLVDQH
jgi:hypothetical protein